MNYSFFFFLKEKNSCVPVSQGRQSLFTPVEGIRTNTGVLAGVWPTVKVSSQGPEWRRLHSCRRDQDQHRRQFSAVALSAWLWPWWSSVKAKGTLLTDPDLWEGNSGEADAREFQTWSFLKLYLANRTGTYLNLISSNSSCFTKCFRLLERIP